MVAAENKLENGVRLIAFFRDLQRNQFFLVSSVSVKK
jgi:hypothetical protein